MIFEFVVEYASMISLGTVSEISYQMVKNKHNYEHFSTISIILLRVIISTYF